MSLFRRRETATIIEPSEIPVPRFSIDGWTLSGTPLAAKLAAGLPRQDMRELETLLHGVAVEADRSLALGFGDMIARADDLGLFVVGFDGSNRQ